MFRFNWVNEAARAKALLAAAGGLVLRLEGALSAQSLSCEAPAAAPAAAGRRRGAGGGAAPYLPLALLPGRQSPADQRLQMG